MLFQSIDKLKRTAIMTTIVLMFIGFILLLLPEGYFPFLNNILAFVLMVIFAQSVFGFIGSSKALINYLMLALGLLAGILGFAFFAFDNFLFVLLASLVCLIPIILGAYGVYHALAFARRSGRKGWWILILLSTLLIAFGGFILINPWADSPRAVVQIVGGTLLYSAFVSAMRLIWIWPIHKN